MANTFLRWVAALSFLAALYMWSVQHDFEWAVVLLLSAIVLELGVIAEKD